jgi:ZIP family zinc transporter
MFIPIELIGFALLPLLGVLIGSLLAESIRTPKWAVGASLHATAGVAIALVSIDVMPHLLATSAIWVIVLAFLVGAGISVLIASVFGSFRHRPGHGGARAGAWMVYMAVATDLVSDGLMVGAGSAVGSGLGFLLASTQAIANIPGGFAATSNFRDDGMPRSRRFVLLVSIIAPALVSVILGYLVLRGVSDQVQAVALAIFMGLLLLATIEDIVPEGDEPEPPRWISTASFAGGFAVFALLSSLVR